MLERLNSSAARALAVLAALAAVSSGTAAAASGNGARDPSAQVIIREWVPKERVTRPPRASGGRRQELSPRAGRREVAPRGQTRRRSAEERSKAVRRPAPAVPKRPAPRRSVAARPAGTSATALNLRAYRLQQQGRHAEAEPLLRQALALRPGYAYALYNLGWSLVEQGRAREALEPLRRTAALQPHRWEPQQRLAEAYAMLGDTRAAAAAAARARALRSGSAPRRSRR